MDDEANRSCRTCGALLAPGATWCSLCYHGTYHDQEGELADELARAFDQRTTYRYEPPDALVEPSPPPVFSRWGASPTSFGPVTKIMLTILLAGLVTGPAAVTLLLIAIGRLPVLQTAHPFFMVYATIGLLAGGLLLRALWRPTRVR